jgi:ABC-type sugar transport system permease subunit
MAVAGKADTSLHAPATAKKPRREMSDARFAFVIGLPVFAFLVLVVAYPLGYSVYMSLHKITFFGGYKTQFAGLENFQKVLADKTFWNALWVTLRFTVESVALTMILGLALALLLNQRFRGAGLVRTMIFLPWCVSSYGAGLMFGQLVKGQTGVFTALSFALGYEQPVDFMSRATVIEVLAIANAWLMSPLVAFFILANLKTIPQRLYHLAAIDRLTRFETFRYVTLPPLQFSLFVFASITTVLSMKLFDMIFVMTGGGPGTASATLTYQIYKRSFKDLNLGYGSAMSFYLLFLILGSTFLLYLLWGRRVSRQ